MTDDFPALRTELRQGYRDLMQVIPDQMKGFGDLHRSAVADGALTQATKELMAVAIGICSGATTASRCTCTTRSAPEQPRRWCTRRSASRC